MELQFTLNANERDILRRKAKWYDDSMTEYHGLDDEEFVNRVCEKTGLSEAEYEDLINGNTEECSWNLQIKGIFYMETEVDVNGKYN